MKRGLLGFSLLVFLIQAVSAQFFSGYGGFSITNFFDSIDSATMTLGLLFFIFFALIFYASSRIFKDPYGQPNKGIAGTIALAVSLLIIYGIYRSGFDLGDLFYGFGIGEGALYLIALIIFIVLAIFLIKKIKLRGFLIVFGLLLILLAVFTDIFYEKLTALIIGIVLLLIGLFLWWIRRRRRGGRGLRPPRRPLWPRRSPREIPSSYEEPMGYGQRLNDGRQKAEEKYQRKLHEGEVERRGRKIKKIRKRREKLEKKGGQPEREGFQYSQGMRRGGLKPTRGRFASKRAIERYARRFGARAARRRFS